MTNSIETFDRISIFLKTTNSVFQLKRIDEQIYFSIERTYYDRGWQNWYPDSIASRFQLENMLKHFLLDDDNTLNSKCCTLRSFIAQLLFGLHVKDNSLIELYNIGQPVSLEEWNIKLDLIGA